MLFAGMATVAFRLALWGLKCGGWLRPEDIPGSLSFVAFYMFFVAVVWLSEPSGRQEASQLGS